MINLLRGREEAAQDVAGRYPTNIFWDAHEPKLLVCEAKLSQNEETSTTPRKAASLLSTIVNTQVGELQSYMPSNLS